MVDRFRKAYASALIASLIASGLIVGLQPAGGAPAVAPSDAPIRPDAVELVNLRTRDSKTFRNPDGTFTAQFASRMHYRSGGVWKDVDARFVDRDGMKVWEQSEFRVECGTGYLRLMNRSNNTVLAWTLPPGSRCGDTTVTYPLGALVWTAEIRRGGVKETADVVTSLGRTRFSFPYRLSADGTFNKRSDGWLTSSAGFFIPPPAVVGRDGNQYEVASWEVRQNSVDLTLDDSGIPASAYPYIIDPSVVLFDATYSADGQFGQVNMTGAQYPPSDGCTVASTFFPLGPATLEIKRTRDTLYRVADALIQWDTSALPDDAAPLGGRVALNVTETSPAGATTRYLRGDWLEWGDEITLDDACNVPYEEISINKPLSEIIVGQVYADFTGTLDGIDPAGRSQLRLSIDDADPTGDARWVKISSPGVVGVSPTLYLNYFLEGAYAVPENAPNVEGFVDGVAGAIGGRYGGAWYHPESVDLDELSVGIVQPTQADQETVSSLAPQFGLNPTHVGVVSVTYSQAQLQQWRNVIRDILDDPSFTALSVLSVHSSINKVVLRVPSRASLGQNLARIEAAVPADALKIIEDPGFDAVATDSRDTWPPYKAGRRINSVDTGYDPTCGSAFVFIDGGTLYGSTAGHCGVVGARIRGRDSKKRWQYVLGTLSHNTFDPTRGGYSDGDAALYPLATAPPYNLIYVNKSLTRKVVKVLGPASLQIDQSPKLCMSGAKSDVHCGKVVQSYPTSVHYKFRNPATGEPLVKRVDNIFCVGFRAAEGDSGSPLYQAISDSVKSAAAAGIAIANLFEHRNGDPQGEAVDESCFDPVFNVEGETATALWGV